MFDQFLRDGVMFNQFLGIGLLSAIGTAAASSAMDTESGLTTAFLGFVSMVSYGVAALMLANGIALMLPCP